MLQNIDEEVHSLAMPDLLSLVSHHECVQADRSVESVYEAFRTHGHEFVAVLSGARLMGVVSRAAVAFLLSGQFGFAIYARKAISKHLLPRFVCAYPGMPLLDVLEQALSREGDDFHHDVPLSDVNGGYLGMIPLQMLVRLQSELILGQMRLAETQRQALHEKNSELFRSLNELRQLEGRFGILFENTALGVALLNSRGEIESCNRCLAGLLGLHPIEVEARRPSFVGLVSVQSGKDDLLRMLCSLEAGAGTGAVKTTELFLHLPGRGLRLFKLHLHWIAESGQICSLLDDITEQRVLERRVAQKEKSAMLESLVGGIAHELNNKLQPVLGFADLLAGGVDACAANREMSEAIEIIRASANEAATIVRQLLQFSRPNTPDLVLSDLRALVEEALTILRFRLREADCETELQFGKEPVYVSADGAQLKQVIVNLVLNALDAMDGVSVRRLYFSIETTSEMAHVRLRDNGSGISQEHLSRIFDPFFTTKAPNRGTGLGLSVSFSIVKQHGGEIAVDSTGSSGTTFRLSLPLAFEAHMEVVSSVAPRVPIDHPPANGSRPRALVVDDEPFITSLIQETLRSRLGYTVDRVFSVPDAMNELRRTPFELVISDVRMPGMSGFDLLDWIMTEQPRLLKRFFFITGDAGGVEMNERIERLGVPVLRKPFRTESLVQQCCTLLAS